jgi:hypothetical protein
VLGVEDGITRLLVLTEGVTAGVLAAGVFSDEVVPDCSLSLLRERLDDVGDGGTPAEAILSGPVLIRPPLSFALRLKARSLCSLKSVCGRRGAVVVGVEGGLEGSRRVGDRREALACRVRRAQRRDDRLEYSDLQADAWVTRGW